MSNFNLPPGVNVNMIPGNRPEDLADEEFWEELNKRFNVQSKERGIHVPDTYADPDWVTLLVEIARDMGYTLGCNDTKMEQDIFEMDEAARVIVEAEEANEQE